MYDLVFFNCNLCLQERTDQMCSIECNRDVSLEVLLRRGSSFRSSFLVPSCSGFCPSRRSNLGPQCQCTNFLVVAGNPDTNAADPADGYWVRVQYGPPSGPSAADCATYSIRS